MRRLLALLLSLPVCAGEPLHIAAVTRKGWPPYEDDRRVYRLEGAEAADLRVGEKLQLRRPGQALDLGRLRVAQVGPGYAEAYLAERGSSYPLRGDRAEVGRAQPLPALPPLGREPDLELPQPRLEAPAESAPSAPAATRLPAASFHPGRVEPIYYLEGDGSLSPKGREKLIQLTRAWGSDGAWLLGVPEDRGLPGRVREARVQGLRRALRSLGVERLQVRAAELRPGDRGDVVYLGKE